MQQEDRITLTADIVSAHVSNNSVAVGDLGNLIQSVHASLQGLGAPEVLSEPEPKKALVSVRASIKPDYLVCMECGSRQKMLKRHLATAHELTPTQYRVDHGLPDTYPMVAPNYSEQRRALAHSIGLGRKKPAASPRGGGRKKSAPSRGRAKKSGADA